MTSSPVTTRAGTVAVALFFLAGLADGVLLPFFALWAHRDAGVPVASVGLLLGCYAGGELLATPLLGGIADRRGRRPVLLISTAGIGVGFLLLPTLPGVVPVAPLLLLIGAFESVLHPTAAAAIADTVPPDRLRRHFALTRMASAAGHVVGPAIGAILATHSLGSVFAGSGLATLAGTAAVAAWLPETRGAGPAAGDDVADDDDPAALLAAFRDARLALLLLPTAILGLATSFVEAVLPLAAAASGTLSPSDVGLLFTWAGLVALLSQWPITRWSARWTGAVVAGASGALLALAFAMLLASLTIPVLVAAVTSVSLAGALYGPTVQAVIAELAPRTARATYMAALSVAQDLQDAAGPAIGTALFALAAALPWAVGLPTVVAAATGLALAARRHEAARAASSLEAEATLGQDRSSVTMMGGGT